MRFHHDRQVMDLSEAQEWLYDAIVDELGHRRQRALERREAKPCVCWLCFGPFDEVDPELFPSS
jgi:hypothetical protein